MSRSPITSLCLKLLPYVLGGGVLFLAVLPIADKTLTTVGDLFSSAKPAVEAKEVLALPPHAPAGGWPHDGAFGTYDRAALQRGYQVYKQVCSACHSMKFMSFRNLSELGFNEAEVKTIAADYQVADGPNDQGDMYQRAGRPSDAFPKPFPNDNAARAANGGALPPDLSLIVKARDGHEDYVYSLLTGFGKTPDAGETLNPGMNYNPYFAGHQIAMPPPLSDNSVTYADGTKATVEQEARDVVQFLAWAGEPTMEERKRTGLKVVLFLVVFAVVMYRVKRSVWKDLH